jgi:hypothetical protein
MEKTSRKKEKEEEEEDKEEEKYEDFPKRFKSHNSNDTK